MIKVIQTLDTGHCKVSAEMSDHALICCAVRTRTGDPRDQRTDLGLVNFFLYFLSKLENFLPDKEPRLWGDWGAKGCCWVRDQCRPEERKAFFGKIYERAPNKLKRPLKMYTILPEHLYAF